jgi:hypothetical protein
MSYSYGTRFNLSELDELLDYVPPQSERWLWMPPGPWRRVCPDPRAESLGYQSAQTYRRDLAALGAIHGSRLNRRLAQLVPSHRRQP